MGAAAIPCSLCCGVYAGLLLLRGRLRLCLQRVFNGTFCAQTHPCPNTATLFRTLTEPGPC